MLESPLEDCSVVELSAELFEVCEEDRAHDSSASTSSSETLRCGCVYVGAWEGSRISVNLEVVMMLVFVLYEPIVSERVGIVEYPTARDLVKRWRRSIQNQMPVPDRTGKLDYLYESNYPRRG